jgi:hypothetical protein
VPLRELARKVSFIESYAKRLSFSPRPPSEGVLLLLKLGASFVVLLSFRSPVSERDTASIFLALSLYILLASLFSGVTGVLTVGLGLVKVVETARDAVWVISDGMVFTQSITFQKLSRKFVPYP